MKRSILSTVISAVCLSLAAISATAAPTHDPTFEANVMTPFTTTGAGTSSWTQTVTMTSDGGYLLVGGSTGPVMEALLPCSPTRIPNMPMPGNEGVFVAENYFRYPLIKLMKNGEMDCNFNLMRSIHSGQGSKYVFPDGEGRIYVTEGNITLYLWDYYSHPGSAATDRFSIARFSDINGAMDGEFIFPSPLVHGVRGIFNGEFHPPFTTGLHYNFITAVGIDNSLPSPLKPKLVVAGSKQLTRESDFKHIWRMNSDGSDDETFQPSKVYSSAEQTGIRKIQVLPSGQILVAGGFREFNGSSFYRSFIRLNEDGTLDESFQVAMEPDSTYSGFEYRSQGGIRDFLVQPDGKIVVAGEFSKTSGIRNLVRLNADGSLDHSFTPPDFISYGSDSTVRLINSVALQDDGKIILSAHVWTDAEKGISPVMRLNSDGTLDKTFNIQFPNRRITWAQSAVFDQECRLVVTFDARVDDPLPNVMLPLTGETLSVPNGIMRLKLEDGVGCIH